MNETWWVNKSQLDDDQKVVLAADRDESLFIVGPPGSGKTNILMLRANFVRSKYPRLVFLTFTRTLTEFLRSGPTVGRADQIKADEITTFMAWGKSALKGAGRSFDLGSGGFRRQRAALIEHLQAYIAEESPGKLYDVAFVDEVQDFTAAELNILSYFSGRINGAGDSRQTIYTTREGLPTMESLCSKKVELRYHYRIGRQICTFADRVLPPRADAPFMIDGCRYDEDSRPSSVTTISCSNVPNQYIECISNIRDQLRYIVDEPVLVLSHTQAVRDAFWDELCKDSSLERIAILQRSDGYEPFGDESIIRVMTIASAKGTEARAVHVLRASGLNQSLRELAFTAVTRAKTEVCLYHSKPLPGHLVPPSDALPTLDEIF